MGHKVHECFIILLLLVLCQFRTLAQESPLADTLDEVSITGQLAPAVYDKTARKITIITSEEIRALPVSSIQEVLEYAAGIDIRQRGAHGVQADVQVRGGTTDQVMVMLNGFNITDPQTGHFSLDIPVDVNSIERVEILHGSGSRVYGTNAHKGVINIITSKRLNNVFASLTAGEHGLLHYSVGGNISEEKSYNSLNFSRNTSDGYTRNTDYRMHNIFYQGGADLNSVDMAWQAGLNSKAFGAANFYSPRFPDQYEETGTAWGSFNIRSSGKVNVSLSGGYRRHNDHFLLRRDMPSFYENYHITNSGGIKLSAGISSKLGNTWAGAEEKIENIISTSLGNELNRAHKVKGTDSTMFDRSYTRNIFNGFFEHNYVNGNFSATGGFLVSVNDHLKNNISFFPGLDVSGKFLGDKLRLYASAARSLRLPTFTDLFYNDPANEGNLLLTPEEQFSLETGSEFRTGRFTCALSFFRDQGRDVIDWVWFPDNSKYRVMNIADLTTRGFETSLDYRNSETTKNFRLNKAVVSWSFIDLEKSTGNFESKYSLDFLKHKFLLGLNQNFFRGLNADLRISYMSRNGSYLDHEPVEGEFSVPFEPYWLTDLKANYERGIFTVFMNISNLFDAYYTDVGNLIQPGRWISLGLRLNVITY